MSHFFNCLQISGLHLFVHLGTTESERIKKQEVKVDINIYLSGSPQVCFSDNINDAICYDQICQLISQTSQKKEFHLIEHLSYTLYQSLKEQVFANYKISLRLTKLSPPIENLKGGASFYISDLPLAIEPL